MVMKRSHRAMLLAAGLITATGIAVVAWPAPKASPEAMIKMSAQGASEEAMLRQIQESKGEIEVTADDIVRMKEARVPDSVIIEMLEKEDAKTE